MSTVYSINKGISRSIEFKGIKAQYIIYLAIGLVALLLLFAVLYITGLHTYLCMGIVIPTGAVLYTGIQRFSKKFGEHGLIKHTSRKRLPAYISASTTRCFTHLSERDYEEEKKTGRRSAAIQN
ncbi:DUF4133 domain-containing protein [Chitinophaga cymbidii]|uniref:Transposase n=1 Tax=Chitinophaga cymbidii TaxID=1096750 RepID=A0A512RFM9_9BACT|nr:DUF4133 domain-containing protein [Chitinophaga cymbidii]GEP94502.1 transposase [Chitinophaga cymbidii]